MPEIASLRRIGGSQARAGLVIPALVRRPQEGYIRSPEGGDLRRRSFLKALAAGAGATAASSLWRRRARAGFGGFPEAAASLRLPDDRCAFNVLEVFLVGGLSAWESLYFVEAYGRPDDPQFPNQQLYAFADELLPAALEACAFPSGAPLGAPFAEDDAGALVQLGPFAHRLRRRADLLERMRLLVQAHDLEPHEAAVPLALTGCRLGAPAMAGLGAHVQRHFQERDGGERAPYAYVIGSDAFNSAAAVGTGLHPGKARPLRIRVGGGDRLHTLLAREGVRDPARHDALRAAYVDQYRERMRWPDTGELVRAPQLSALDDAVRAVTGADTVRALLPAELLAPRSGSACAHEAELDATGTSLRVAAHLLNHPHQPARYVCVLDTGLVPASGGGGYDTHTANCAVQAINLDNLFRHLVALINAPGERDPAKLDLDRTLIVLNTEFGRDPVAETLLLNRDGRDHNPQGYVTALLGGPITAAQRAVAGAIGRSGAATSAISPSENRVAALLALGIWPFSPEAFRVSDVPGAADEVQAVRRVSERALGYAL